MINHNHTAATLSPTYTDGTRTTSGMPSPHHDDQNQMFRDLEAQGLAGTEEFIRKAVI